MSNLAPPSVRRLRVDSPDLATQIAKNRRTGLGRYLRRIAQASVAAAALAACSTSHTGGPDAATDAMPDTIVMGDTSVPPDTTVPTDTSVPPDTTIPPMAGPFCDDSGNWDALSGIDRTIHSGYAALLKEQLDGFGPSWYYNFQSVGEPCAEATEPDACRAELARLEAETFQRAILYTDFDGAHAATTMGDVMELMGGVIDTPNKAVLLAYMAGYEIHCTGPEVTTATRTDEGWDVVAFRYMVEGCDILYYRAPLFIDAFEGTVTPNGPEEYVGYIDSICAIGRRPAGLAARGPADQVGPVADFFAEVARLEESAVAAFDVMIDELAALGAPAGLLDGARAARADEVRHTESMGALARSFGAEPRRPEISEPEARTPYEIALENAVEGCIRETYGALVATHQAMSAEDPRIAAAMKVVSDDEIRHAELSWALASWLEPQLSDEERAQIEEARHQAVTELLANANAPVHPSLVKHAGMPDPATNARLLSQLAADIWA